MSDDSIIQDGNIQYSDITPSVGSIRPDDEAALKIDKQPDQPDYTPTITISLTNNKVPVAPIVEKLVPNTQNVFSITVSFKQPSDTEWTELTVCIIIVVYLFLAIML